MTTVLIIDDNPNHAELAATLLELNGYAVLNADSAEAGLRLAHERSPDLVLVDIVLPGMDGLTAVRLLKADPTTQAIKVIVLTAYRDKYSAADILQTGADAFLSKPYHHQDFLNTVSTVLARGDAPH